MHGTLEAPEEIVHMFDYMKDEGRQVYAGEFYKWYDLLSIVQQFLWQAYPAKMQESGERGAASSSQ